jgi:predicted PurR-regulated permease PerM
MAKASAAPQWQRSLVALTATVLTVVVIGTLYWAQVIFIPLGMAIFLTFLLTPVVRALQRRGLHRTLAVIVVMLATTCCVIGAGWIVGRQVSGLIDDLPNYTDNIRGKVKSVRSMFTRSGRFDRMLEQLGAELNLSKPQASQPPPADPSGESGEADAEPPTVIVQPESPAWLAQVPAYIDTATEPLGGVALALVLVIFMLLNHEDLRSRFLRLVAGNGRMSSTTRALDDAAHRISRYLLMQAVINATYGLALALGLLLIGVKYALLWGFLAAVLRYVPYIGPWIAAMFPIVLSLALFESWWPPLAVVTFVLVLELISNNLLEPWLYGQSIGVSAVAQLLSAAFWAFLWGPIGLVLSAPMTVVLLVLGKHVPQLEFLEILLGDEPVLDPDVVYYQRLVARDHDEAAELVFDATKSGGAESVYDTLLIPALNLARRDVQKHHLARDDHDFILEATHEFLEDLSEPPATADAEAAPPAEERVANGQPRVRVWACPAKDESDRLALLMLEQLLDQGRWDVEVLGAGILTGELLERVAQDTAAIVCIGALPPGGLAHTRYLCKRLRAQYPKLHIVVGRWGLKGSLAENREQLQESGADSMATTLVETKAQLEKRRLLLAQQAAERAAPQAKSEVVGSR